MSETRTFDFNNGCGEVFGQTTDGSGNTVSGSMMTNDISKKQLQRAARDGAASLEVYVNQHDQVWYKAAPTLYARTIQSACQLAVNTYPLSKDSQLIAARMAELALTKPQPPAPAQTVDLLSFVRPSIAPDAQTRHRFTALWIEAWTRIEAVVDPNFDPRDKPLRNVPPPLGGHRAGIDPKEIEDARERATYEEALTENQRKVTYHTEQNEYGRVLGKLRPRLIREIASTYANMPEYRVEFQEFLVSLPKRLRDEIISAVSEKRTEPFNR
jgi:hypothetical protein